MNTDEKRLLIGRGAGVLFLIALWGVRYCINDQMMKILLYPYAFIGQFFYPIQLVYRDAIGYVSQRGDFIISSACLGNTFMIMVFIVSYFGFIERFKEGKIYKWFVRSSFLSLGLGYFINSLRILASIPFIKFRYFGMMHTAIGIVLYFGSITILYISLMYLFERGECYEIHL